MKRQHKILDSDAMNAMFYRCFTSFEYTLSNRLSLIHQKHGLNQTGQYNDNIPFDKFTYILHVVNKL